MTPLDIAIAGGLLGGLFAAIRLNRFAFHIAPQSHALGHSVSAAFTLALARVTEVCLGIARAVFILAVTDLRQPRPKRSSMQRRTAWCWLAA